MSEAPRRLRVAFVHPELGLGGAERLVVDCAASLQERGHEVVLFTAHLDPARAFAETTDGTLPVRVHGSFLPLHIGQRLRAPCTLARLAWLGGAVARERPFDLVFCDVAAQVVPLLRALQPGRVIFYCHFPDLLLTPERRSWYRLYRWPLDRLEARAARSADLMLVNSEYTAGVARSTFALRRPPTVLYPAVEPGRFAAVPPAPREGELTLLSISRFERSKGARLAVEALAALRTRVAPALFARLRLILAGGFDPRLLECRRTAAELEALARARGVGEQVRLAFSISDEERLRLLAASRIVVYTPEREHFGIVPLEAMAAGRPVVAVARGGPMETVLHGETGLLAEPTAEGFAEALRALIEEPERAERMGEAGRARAAACFSRAALGERLEQILLSLHAQERPPP